MTANCMPTYAAIAHRCSQMRISLSNDGIEVERAAASQPRIPVPAFLHDSLLSLEVAVHDSETLLKSLSPFEVVGEGPQKIAAHVGARLHRASDLGNKAAEKADPALIVDFAVGAGIVAV